MKKRRIVVTAALPYANGDIHLGHLLEYLQTDYWVRFQKMRGHECVYICADDTHGTPIMIRARKEGRTPEELIASMWERHFKDFSDFQDLRFHLFASWNGHLPSGRQDLHVSPACIPAGLVTGFRREAVRDVREGRFYSAVRPERSFLSAFLRLQLMFFMLY